MPKLVPVVAVIAALGLLVAACGGSDEQAATETTSPIAGSATFNDADVSFAQGMIPHHSQAVDMATMAVDQSTNPAVLDIAARIQGAQDPEIELMRGWLAEWGEGEMTSDMETMEGMDHGSVEGMMTAEQMDELTGASGAAFDALFVDMMIEHHQGAIAMAEAVLSEGVDPDVHDLAQQIIEAQQGEIAEMQSFSAK